MSSRLCQHDRPLPKKRQLYRAFKVFEVLHPILIGFLIDTSGFVGFWLSFLAFEL